MRPIHWLALACVGVAFPAACASPHGDFDASADTAVPNDAPPGNDVAFVDTSIDSPPSCTADAVYMLTSRGS